MSDGTTPCYRCAGTGRVTASDVDWPWVASFTVYDRWETIRDLQIPPFVGQIALDAQTGRRLLWDGEGWVGLTND